MNEQSFNKELAKIAPDLRLLFNKYKHLWGVYQVRGNHIQLLDNTEAKPWLLWDIVDENKAFRLPDNRDLNRAMGSVVSGREAFSKGGEWYADKLDKMDQDNIDAARERTDTKVREAAREVKFHTTVARNSNWGPKRA